MAVVTLPVVTTPSGTHLVDANGNPISSLDGGFPTVDRIRSLIMAGQGFTATSGTIATATNANVKIGLELFVNQIVKSVFIYRINAALQQLTGDISLNSHTALDANLTATPTIFNQNPGSSNTSLATVKASPAGATAGTSKAGSIRNQYGSSAVNPFNQELLQNGDGIFIPVNTANVGIITYVNAPTATNSGQVNIWWVEF
jgi:hypothetical protein